MESKRVVWIMVHGVPCHAWCLEFFEFLANSMRRYICMDENTKSASNMDIGRFLITVPFDFNLKERLMVSIDGLYFNLLLWEDAYGLGQIVKNYGVPKSNDTSLTSSEDSWSIHEGSSFGEDEEGRSWDSQSKDKKLQMDNKREEGIEIKVKRGYSLKGEGPKGAEDGIGMKHVSGNPCDNFDAALLLTVEDKSSIIEKGRGRMILCLTLFSVGTRKVMDT